MIARFGKVPLLQLNENDKLGRAFNSIRYFFTVLRKTLFAAACRRRLARELGRCSIEFGFPIAHFFYQLFDRYDRRLLPARDRPWQALEPSLSPVVPGCEPSPVDALRA
jgi:hypothetical protein